MEKNRWENDCEYCKYLGRFKEFDLYYCKQGGLPTVIARYGNGPDYVSGLELGAMHKLNMDSGIGTAYRRAVMAGLIKS